MNGITSRSVPRIHTRAASSSVHPVRPARGWSLPDFQRAKRAIDLPAPRVQRFENKVALPNDGRLTLYTVAPRGNIVVSRDTSNHPLWAFPSKGKGGRDASQDEDGGGRMGKFARRYGQQQAQQAAQVANVADAPAPPSAKRIQASISEGQEAATRAMQSASGADVAGATGTGAAAAEQIVTEAAATATTKPTSAQEAAADNDNPMDMFDLTLDGEVVEEPKHKVVEGGKAEKGKGKKGGKR